MSPRMRRGSKIWAVILGIAALVVFVNQQNGLMLLVGLALLLANPVIYISKQFERSRDLRRLSAEIQTHARTLVIRRSALISTNGYGQADPKAWAREVKKFVTSSGFSSSRLTTDDVTRVVTTAVDQLREAEEASTNPQWTEAINSSDATAFERACASELRAMGWNASTTAGSGDHGVDVVATKGTARAVIQCKLYSSPVGNAAVQEALAGKAFYKASLAAVVTNSTFTPKAHELAGTTGVLLLHFLELAQLDAATAAVGQAPVSPKPNQPAERQRGVLGNYRGEPRS